MTDHPSPEHIAARIAGELESITEACPTNPCLRSCHLCVDCLTKLEEAIAAALAAKDAEIVAIRDNNERVKELFDQRAVALTQARARLARLEQALEHEKALGLGKHLSTREGVTSVHPVVRLAPLEEALRATSPEEP